MIDTSNIYKDESAYYLSLASNFGRPLLGKLSSSRTKLQKSSDGELAQFVWALLEWGQHQRSELLKLAGEYGGAAVQERVNHILDRHSQDGVGAHLWDCLPDDTYQLRENVAAGKTDGSVPHPEEPEFIISGHEFQAFTMICALLLMGFQTPIKILQRADELAGQEIMLNVAHMLWKHVDGPVPLWCTSKDGTLEFTTTECFV